MTSYGMVIDITRCNGCYNCAMACKDEYVGNEYPPYSAAQPEIGQFWINIMYKERGRHPRVKTSYIPAICMHCESAPCVEAAKERAVHERDDGIVIIDPEKSKGQRQIVSSCPYGAIYWNEEKNIPQKCTFCAHLLDQGWKEPRCVEACPSNALHFGDIKKGELCTLITSGKAKTLSPEYGQKTKVYYIGIPKQFIAGNIVLGDKEECAENARVTLVDQSTGLSRVIFADNYGDFEFEDLPTGRTYLIKVEMVRYFSKEYLVKLEKDEYIGEVVLERT